MAKRTVPGIFLTLKAGIAYRTFGFRLTRCPATHRRKVHRIYYGNGWPPMRFWRRFRISISLREEPHWLESMGVL